MNRYSDYSTIYRQLSLKEALEAYCDWLLQQQEPDGFFRCYELGKPIREWYMIFYPVRTLLLGGKILGKKEYMDTAFKCVDMYLTEQLPNGGFTSNFRGVPTENLSKKEFNEILRCGKVNLADNGSNITAVIQAAGMADSGRREKYLNAARKWFDNWVAIWALPEGGYGNGIWVGHKLNSPYTCAMSNVATAFSIYTRVSGDREYVENAERCIAFQCSKWLDEDDGRPVFLDCYPLPAEFVLNDYGHAFYLLEGMCWTHSVTSDPELRKRIEDRLKLWIFGKKGLLSQWADSWFNFMVYCSLEKDRMPDTRFDTRLGWEMAKSNGILHAFLYYLNNIEDNEQLRSKVQLGLNYLTHPLKARMSGVMSDPDESYGAFAVQATGFAGLSIAEAIEPGIVFMNTKQGCRS